MDFNFALAHPNGVIKVEVTGASPQAAVASIQMGHEIMALLGGVVTDQAPVEIAPNSADNAVTAAAYSEGPIETVAEPETKEKPAEPEEVAQFDSEGTPFDPELHTGTLKKDGTWRLKKGAASKVEETESEGADEGEPEGNEPANSATADAGEKSAASTDGTATSGSTTSTSSTATNDASPSDEELPEITDTELQRYCGRLVQHFGKSDPVFALAAEFVPDGEMPRPTMIKDQAQRRAFIAKAQEQTGVVYHG